MSDVPDGATLRQLADGSAQALTAELAEVQFVGTTVPPDLLDAMPEYLADAIVAAIQSYLVGVKAGLALKVDAWRRAIDDLSEDDE